MALDSNLYEKLIEYNKKYEENARNGRIEKMPYEYEIGSIPIILSAPHSVNQIRNGKLKVADGFTGGIAKYLAKACHTSYIIKTFNNQDDANYDIEENPYKEKILEMIDKNNSKLLLDIHGCSNRHRFHIDIGTDDGNNIKGRDDLIQELVDSLKEAGIDKIQVNKKFKAHPINTISKTIATKTNIPCIQIEIANYYRIPIRQNRQRVEQIIIALSNFITKVQNMI